MKDIKVDRISVLSKGKPPRIVCIPDSRGEVKSLRVGQDQLVAHILAHRWTLNVSPTGSGKSISMLCLAAYRAKRGLGTIIIVPKMGISKGFEKYTRNGKFHVTGLEQDFVFPQGAIVIPDAKKGKIADLVGWVKMPIPRTGRVIVCSYAAFCEMIGAVDIETLGQYAVLVDEGHHSAVDEDNPEGGTVLGSIIDQICDTTDVHYFTATDFRSDGHSILPPRHVDNFHRFKLTLQQHFQNGGCPDFDLHFRFYDRVAAAEHDRFNNFGGVGEAVKIGSPEKLIDAYIKTYRESPIPTLMLIPSQVRTILGGKLTKAVQIAKVLNDRLCSEFPGLRILNLGSSCGKKLESEKGGVENLYAKLDDGSEWDVVIAIRTMDEGSDWPDCAQTFSPSISASLGLIMQRAVGRALRLKREEHISPSKSHVWFFEMGITEEERPVITDTLWRLAIRIKTLCFGAEWSQSFEFQLDQPERELIDEEKAAVAEIDTGVLYSIDESLNEFSMKADLPSMILEIIDQYRQQGIIISAHTAIELLIEKGLIGSNQEPIECKRLIGSLRHGGDFNEFCQFLVDNGFKTLTPIETVAELLGEWGDMASLRQLVLDFVLDSSEKKKAHLIAIASDKGNKPSSNTIYYKALCSYIYDHSSAYDPIFRAKIYMLAPHWFENTADSKRDQLLELARDKGKRPPYRTELGAALGNYLRDNRSRKFKAEIYKLAPHWFEDTVVIYKDRLRLMAAVEARPSSRTKLGAALCNYICEGSNSYDEQFTNEIHKLAPRWFTNKTMPTKDELFEIAGRGGARPNPKTKLGWALCRYTSSKNKSYDPVFDAEIRKLAPHWFKSCITERKKPNVATAIQVV